LLRLHLRLRRCGGLKDGGLIDRRSGLRTLPTAVAPALTSVVLTAVTLSAIPLRALLPRTAVASLTAFALRHLGLDTLRDRRGFLRGRIRCRLTFFARSFLRKRGGKGSRCQQCSNRECLFHDCRSVERACTIVAASHATGCGRVGLNEVWQHA
jgi:hypothetical protein